MPNIETDNWWARDLDYSSRTDIGMRRTNNQDSHKNVIASTYRQWKTRGHLFIVADGMGAHAAGELASQLAVDTISQSYIKRTEESPPKALEESIYQAHELIRRRGTEEPAFHEMGTTADALLFLPEGAYVGHVGDSRVYRLRGKQFEQLTFDHSLVWELKRTGRVPVERIPAYIPKNIITRSLGPTEKLIVAMEGPFPLEVGDAFLMCSDGLSGQFSDEEIGEIVSLFPPDEATLSLINIANLRGGPDNITVTIARVLGIPEEIVDRKQKKRDRVYAKRPRLPLSALMSLTLGTASLIVSALFAFLNLKENLPVCLVSFLFSLAFFFFFFCNAQGIFWRKKTNVSISEPLGKGPYSSASAELTEEFVKSMVDLRVQLSDAILERNPFRDQEFVQSLLTEAEDATKRNDYSSIVKSNIRIINKLIADLKSEGLVN